MILILSTYQRFLCLYQTEGFESDNQSITGIQHRSLVFWTLNSELHRSTIFGSILEDILSSTLSNIMEEAAKGEVVLTSRPRVVALPPSTGKQKQKEQIDLQVQSEKYSDLIRTNHPCIVWNLNYYCLLCSEPRHAAAPHASLVHQDRNVRRPNHIQALRVLTVRHVQMHQNNDRKYIVLFTSSIV